jgi:hypothetical protein
LEEEEEEPASLEPDLGSALTTIVVQDDKMQKLNIKHRINCYDLLTR